MPELPEVETTKRGISPHIKNNRVTSVQLRHSQLRWPIPHSIVSDLKQQLCLDVTRRAKYLLLHFKSGVLIIHLGMSGRLSIVESSQQPKKHDHVDIFFDSGICLRYTDPRRFGCILWTDNLSEHRLLVNLGPEPLTSAFDTDYLYQCSREKKVTVKQLIMNSAVVVGVGNIYASESLFMAGINPQRQASRISKKRYELLVAAIKSVLQQSIKVGGTTLKDFLTAEGKPGYFSQQLDVYGREGEPCRRCARSLKKVVIMQRSTFYCSQCQR